MKSINPDPDFIVILGDFVSHSAMEVLNSANQYDINFNKYILRQTIMDVYTLIEDYFPNTQILPVIGNNDGYEDYNILTGREGAEYLAFLYETWQPTVWDISGSFYDGGYY